MTSSRPAKASSGSSIQNSARCLLVFEFSARNVGPKVYTSRRAQAYVSASSWPDTVRKAGPPKKSSSFPSWPAEACSSASHSRLSSSSRDISSLANSFGLSPCSLALALASFTTRPCAATASLALSSSSSPPTPLPSGAIVVTLKASPAPSQSLLVITGVFTYENPFLAKKAWVCCVKVDLTLAALWMVLVLGLRWAIDLRNSSECFFFCRGYSSAGQAPKTSISSHCSSRCWPLARDSTSLPLTRTEHPVVHSPPATRAWASGAFEALATT
mmetsp:Transcript_8945/g.27105  ORF Transcript_8945/g.27105 Transcript_8945/m.27105 type:complete len:272 (+) Transcript_8945:1337-2152(+)